MKINVTIKRSGEWIKAQRLARGENVPEEYVVAVEVIQLCEDVRQRILEWLGCYRDLRDIGFCQDYTPSPRGATYGRACFKCDSDSPTPDEINSAIAGAFAELDAKRTEYLAEKSEREAEEAATKAQKAEAARRLEEARLLLSKDLAERDELRKKRDTLSKFLAAVPLDALRGTVKRIVSSEAEIENRQKLIEDASSDWIFSNRDDDE
jgi:hypothetical protein